MRLRFSSGSVTPARASRKKSVASTSITLSLVFSRKKRSTLADSPVRMRPLFTWMQVSWSPMARCTRAATTDESTPPDRAQSTRSVPTRARISATVWSMNECMVQSGRQLHRPKTKLRSTSVPIRVWATSGWNWTATNGLSAWRMAAQGECGLVAVTANPGAIASIRSPWLIHTW